MKEIEPQPIVDILRDCWRRMSSLQRRVTMALTSLVAFTFMVFAFCLIGSSGTVGIARRSAFTWIALTVLQQFLFKRALTAPSKS